MHIILEYYTLRPLHSSSLFFFPLFLLFPHYSLPQSFPQPASRIKFGTGYEVFTLKFAQTFRYSKEFKVGFFAEFFALRSSHCNSAVIFIKELTAKFAKNALRTQSTNILMRTLRLLCDLCG